jgi:hypothetical protein
MEPDPDSLKRIFATRPEECGNIIKFLNVIRYLKQGRVDVREPLLTAINNALKELQPVAGALPGLDASTVKKIDEKYRPLAEQWLPLFEKRDAKPS